jgi:hypothetical protein
MSNRLKYYDHCKNGYLYADQFEQELQRQQLSEECAKQEVIRWCTNHTEREERALLLMGAEIIRLQAGPGESVMNSGS